MSAISGTIIVCFFHGMCYTFYMFFTEMSIIKIQYVEINVIVFLMVVATLIAHRKNSMNSQSDKAFRSIGFVLLWILVVDAALWVIDGMQFPGAHALSYFCCATYFPLIPLVGYSGWMYINRTLRGSGYLNKKRMWLFAVPTIAGGLLTLAAMPSKLLFYIDSANVYHRGDYFFLTLIAPVFYVALASWEIIRVLRTKPDVRVRQQCIALAMFFSIPFAAYIVQALCYGVSISCAAFALAFTIMFISMQSTQISLDALTGVNNRTRLQQFLSAAVHERNSGDMPLYALMMDIDDFKSINDSYGHMEGDDILRHTAQILKKACADAGDFLARYGGDEFVMICRRESDEAIQNIIAFIERAVDDYNAERKLSYPLSLSVGMAKLEPGMDAQKLFCAADSSMYRAKAQKKKRASKHSKER